MTRSRADDDLAAAGLPPLPRTAWLEIDLDRLAGNLRLFRAAIPAGVRVEPVVKADAYGHGAVPVARALERAGADGLSVASWDEALQLRRAGIRIPVLVLYPVPPGVVRDAAAERVTLTVGDPVLLGRTLQAASLLNRAAGVLRIEVEIETGLGRGGFTRDDLPEAVRAINAVPNVVLVGGWSHLGAADDRERSRHQQTQFDEARAIVAQEAGERHGWHLAASGGILADVAQTHDAIRPGLSIYGVIPDDLSVASRRSELAAALRPVLSLHARPVRVVDLPAGAGVSYGKAFVTARPSRIATLPVGYADGYRRALTNRAEVLVRGGRVPVVGTVAMDAVMVDVTDVAGAPVTVDDEFVLLGDQGTGTVSASELARRGTTISWEVLAGMSRRIPRVYYADARAVGVRTLTDESG